jgi:hypothetical protein
MIKEIIVLSGGNAKHGSSGAPVLDENKNIIAMVVGRSRERGGYKYLAIDTSQIWKYLVQVGKAVVRRQD